MNRIKICKIRGLEITMGRYLLAMKDSPDSPDPGAGRLEIFFIRGPHYPMDSENRFGRRQNNPFRVFSKSERGNEIGGRLKGEGCTRRL